jgi:cytochrome c oxidase subunit 2
VFACARHSCSSKNNAPIHRRRAAQTRAEFDRWVDQQAEVPAAPATVDAVRGAHLFDQQTCVSYHRISGTRANAEVGPDLTHVASRTTLGSGVISNTPEHLTRWLENPQAIKPGAGIRALLSGA